MNIRMFETPSLINLLKQQCELTTPQLHVSKSYPMAILDTLIFYAKQVAVTLSSSITHLI